MKMSQNLRRLMKERNITVSELASQAKVPRKTLYHWLNGQSPRNLDQFLDVCIILNVSIEELLDRAPIEKNRPVPLKELQQTLSAGVFEIFLCPVQVQKDEKK